MDRVIICRYGLKCCRVCIRQGPARCAKDLADLQIGETAFGHNQEFGGVKVCQWDRFTYDFLLKRDLSLSVPTNCSNCITLKSGMNQAAAIVKM